MNQQSPRGWQGVFLRACAALCPADGTCCAGAVRSLDAAGWQKITVAAERHGLIGLVSRSLDWAEKELGVSIPVSERLSQVRQSQLLQMLERRNAARQAANALAARNVAFVIY